ncbi:uridine diphosphate glucose pyrophosphatase NUDT22 [Kryptolebias marmoratus]|uniref:uridine diphosphate glucose pyrophosphatase NUDT22 n=1 Tax=Kryptolebias marmoratus TaxID=37003 RepID=UPI0007F917CA|nr:uridine diphosphate glucose pyrophosphatase NUDT22 [Kryptolebias marmoratus]
MIEEMNDSRPQTNLMDPEVSVLLHCAHWRGLLEPQVQVELSERFNRQTDLCLEHHIKEVWAERLSKEPWLFNGAKFRLHSFCLAPLTHPHYSQSSHVPVLHCAEDQEQQRGDGVAALHSVDIRNGCINQTGVVQKAVSTLSQESATCDGRESKGPAADRHSHPGPLLVLRLGLTCYKDYLGTNWSCQVAELRRRGEKELSDPLALLAQPLGVGAVLCTDDGQVVLIRRSQKVAEAGGLLDIPGGHPEPKVVCERLGQQVCEEQISVVMMQQRPDAVVSELFSSVCAEIRDEVNVPLSSLGAPVLMGVALNHTSAGRPSAEFFVRCSLSSDEVRNLYWKGGAEANESTDVVFLSRTEVLQLDGSSPLWSEMCPSAKGAVLLYQTVKPDVEPTAGKPRRSVNTKDPISTKCSN